MLAVTCSKHDTLVPSLCLLCFCLLSLKFLFLNFMLVWIRVRVTVSVSISLYHKLCLLYNLNDNRLLFEPVASTVRPSQ